MNPCRREGNLGNKHESLASRSGRFTHAARAPSTHWIRG